MATSKAAQGGAVTGDLCAYYAERAAGGCIGLIVTEHCFISPEGRAHAGSSIASDADVPGLRRLDGYDPRARLEGDGADQPWAARHSPVTRLRALSPSGVRLPRTAGRAPRRT